MTRSPSAAAEMGVAGPGTVGPMASSALHLPSVEKALGVAPDPDASIGSANLSDRHHARQDSGRLGEATEKFARLSSRKVSPSFFP